MSPRRLQAPIETVVREVAQKTYSCTHDAANTEQVQQHTYDRVSPATERRGYLAAYHRHETFRVTGSYLVRIRRSHATQKHFTFLSLELEVMSLAKMGDGADLNGNLLVLSGAIVAHICGERYLSYMVSKWIEIDAEFRTAKPALRLNGCAVSKIRTRPNQW